MALYTNDTTMITKLRKLGYDVSDTDDFGGIQISIPVNRLTIRKAEGRKASSRKGQKLSPEHIAKMQAGRKKGK